MATTTTLWCAFRRTVQNRFTAEVRAELAKNVRKKCQARRKKQRSAKNKVGWQAALSGAALCFL